MRRSGLSSIFVCLLALWVQILIPVAAAAASNDPLATSIICAHDSGDLDAGRSHQSPPASHNHHCPLCQTCLAGAVLPQRPHITGLVYSNAKRLHWAIETQTPRGAQAQRPGLPRGPPQPV